MHRRNKSANARATNQATFHMGTNMRIRAKTERGEENKRRKVKREEEKKGREV